MSEGEGSPRFSDDQARALACVLDEIIPRSEDGRLPGAGELGLVHYIEEALPKSPGFEPLIAQGLAALDDRARVRGAEGFAALSPADRRETLKELVADQPGFLPGLIFHSYAGYYQHATVLEALGLEPRPPHPKGYELEPGDLELLDAVRRRPRLYREC